MKKIKLIKFLIIFTICFTFLLSALIFPGGADIRYRRKTSRADLKVVNVTITPDKPRARKDMITISVTVKNLGNATPSRRCSLTMSIWSVDQNGNRITPGDSNSNAIPWYTNNIPQLNPGDQIKISKTITLRYAGRHMVSGVIITEGLQGGEENPVNNDYKKYFMAYGPPKKADLVLTKVGVTSNGRIKLRMCNKGHSISDVDYNTCSYVKIVIGIESKSIHFRDIDPSGILQKGSPAAGLAVL